MSSSFINSFPVFIEPNPSNLSTKMYKNKSVASLNNAKQHQNPFFKEKKLDTFKFYLFITSHHVLP